MQVGTGAFYLQTSLSVSCLAEVKDSCILPAAIDAFVPGDDDTFGSRTVQVVNVRCQQVVLPAEEIERISREA